jgi:ABC-2 type transport system ATP-binding protein
LKNFKVIDGGLIWIYEQGVTQSEISSTLVLQQVAIESIIKKSSSLEDYFFKLINGGGGNVSFNEAGVEKV